MVPMPSEAAAPKRSTLCCAAILLSLASTMVLKRAQASCSSHKRTATARNGARSIAHPAPSWFKFIARGI